jgi:hypothetical protein
MKYMYYNILRYFSLSIATLEALLKATYNSTILKIKHVFMLVYLKEHLISMTATEYASGQTNIKLLFKNTN